MTAGECSLSWRPGGPYAYTPCWDGWVAATIVGGKLQAYVVLQMFYRCAGVFWS